MDRRRIGLIGAVASIVVLYFASGSPIPLYSMYQGQLGLTQGQLSMTSVCYLLGTVVSLLFFPRLSDHLGRRPVTVMILAISFLGCFVYVNLTSPEMLMAGRLIQGIVSGLGSSTVAAYVVDLCSDLPKWVGPAITSSAPPAITNSKMMFPISLFFLSPEKGGDSRLAVPPCRFYFVFSAVSPHVPATARADEADPHEFFILGKWRCKMFME